MVTADPKNHK
jgi:hypothetical protein